MDRGDGAVDVRVVRLPVAHRHAHAPHAAPSHPAEERVPGSDDSGNDRVRARVVPGAGRVGVAAAKANQPLTVITKIGRVVVEAETAEAAREKASGDPGFLTSAVNLRDA